MTDQAVTVLDNRAWENRIIVETGEVIQMLTIEKARKIAALEGFCLQERHEQKPERTFTYIVAARHGSEWHLGSLSRLHRMSRDSFQQKIAEMAGWRMFRKR